MNPIPDALTRDVLTLPAAAWFHRDDALLRAREQAACRYAFRGFAVAVPPRAPADSLPVLVLDVRDARQTTQVSAYDNLLVVASPLVYWAWRRRVDVVPQPAAHTE